MQLARIGAARARRVHVRNHRGQPQRRVEQCERRKRRQIHTAGLHAERIAQQVDLADEMPVAIHHAFGHTGRATGKQDRRHIVGRGVGQLAVCAGTIALHPRQRDSTQP